MPWKAILINSDTFKVQEISDAEEARYADKVNTFISKSEDENGMHTYGVFMVDRRKISAVIKLRDFLRDSLRITKEEVLIIEQELNIVESWHE